MSEDKSELEADHPIRWLVWEWQNSPMFMIVMVAAFVLAFVYMPKLGNYGFVLPCGLTVALMANYFVWTRAVKHGKIEAQ